MITAKDVEKAFADPVEYRLSPWSNATALRRPSAEEIKRRLLLHFKADSGSRELRGEVVS
ncbi:hypothetical protein ACQZ6B_01230 [Agrobacterium vitis]